MVSLIEVRAILLLLALDVAAPAWASTQCARLKDELPIKIYEYASSLRGDLGVLGMALDELLPAGHSYEPETVLTKARDLLADDNWDKLSLGYYLETLVHDKDRLLLGAINMFHSLRDCLYRCDYASSLTLAANYLAAFENELYPAEDDRVKWTILRVANLHGEKCLPGYLSQLSSIEATFDEATSAKLEIIFNSELVGKILANKHIREVSSLFLADRLLQVRSELFDRVAIVLKDTDEAKYVAAKKSGTGQHDYLVQPEFKTRAIARHLIEPCRKFAMHFRDLFYPMQLDLALMEQSGASDKQAHDLEGNERLASYWTRYRLCRELSIDRLRFADLIAGELPNKLGLVGPSEPQ